MSILTSSEFWSASLERCVKTFAQAVLAVIGVGVFTPADIDWKQVLLGAGIAALASVLTSVASAGTGNPGPSLASEELVPAAPVPPAGLEV